MRAVSRRSFIHRSLGLAAAGAVARPYVANSAAATATVSWTQGFAQEEDVAFKKIVADYEKASGNRGPYVQQGLLGPILSTFWTFNPAYARVQNEHVWPTAWSDIMTGGMTPQAAAQKAFKRVEEIFAKYPVAQG